MCRYCLLLLCLVTTLFSCTKYGYDDEYIVMPCRVEIKAGSTFELCTKFYKPIEKLVFEENTILSGSRVDYHSESNKYSYRIENIGRSFAKSKMTFNDFDVTFINDSISWIGSFATRANLFFENIEYYEMNDSVCHFRCYGDKANFLCGASNRDSTLRVCAEIKITVKR